MFPTNLLRTGNDILDSECVIIFVKVFICCTRANKILPYFMVL